MKGVAALVILVFLASASYSSEIHNDSGGAAGGLEVRFSDAVKIVAFGDAFARVEPEAESTEFVFSMGTVKPGEAFAIDWEPSEAVMETYEWTDVSREEGGGMSQLAVGILIGVASGIATAVVVGLAVRSPRLMKVVLGAVSQDYSFGRRLSKCGVSNFYSSREDYALYRGAPRLQDYLVLAEHQIEIAAYWMSHGTEMENIAEHIGTLVRQGKNITIAAANPDGTCVGAFALHMGLEVEELQLRIRASMNKLWQVREGLSDVEQRRFLLLVYDSIPVASVIMLDADSPSGRIQVDLKPYRAPRQDSFAIELRGSDKHLYKVIRRAWRDLLHSATEYRPPPSVGT